MSETCGCIAVFNKRFAAQNCEIATKTWTNVQTGTCRVTVEVPVRKRDASLRKWSAIRLIPTYCPMCGQKYERQESASE